jgi:hypothetical protein
MKNRETGPQETGISTLAPDYYSVKNATKASICSSERDLVRNVGALVHEDGRALHKAVTRDVIDTFREVVDILVLGFQVCPFLGILLSSLRPLL